MLAVAGTGCVTQSTYDALATEKSALETTLDDKNKAITAQEARHRALETKHQTLLTKHQDLEKQLSAEQDKVKELSARIDRLVADMASATKDKSRLQASVEQMTRALAELEKRRAESEARVAEFKNLLSKFRTLIDAGKLKVRIVDGRMVVVLATDILFSSGSASLSKDGKVALSEVAQVLATIERRTFQVEGHTDSVPISTAQFPSNWELAAARAITVLKSMTEAGMPAGRISAAAFADTRPVAPNETTEGKAQNRRIDIVIVPDLSALPGFDELKKVDTGS